MSHLLFADDSLLFFRAGVNQARNINEVLHTFGRAMGQLINPNKCYIMFGESCPAEVIKDTRTKLQLQQANFEAKYLGLPTVVGRMKKDRFQPTRERLSERGLSYGWRRICHREIEKSSLNWLRRRSPHTR